MPRVIGLVADEMLTKPALPDTALAARLADRTQAFLLRQSFGKSRFNQTPSRREAGGLRLLKMYPSRRKNNENQAR